MYQDLCSRHDWPVKKAIVDLTISMKVNSKRLSGNSLSPFGDQNGNLGVTNRGKRDFKIQRRGRRQERQKKIIGFISKTTALHVYRTFFVYFFPVFSRLQRENA